MPTPANCAPELRDTTRVSQSSDVYSFGVVLLELLTGKPSHVTILGNEESNPISLVEWIHFVVRREWTAQVFDSELMGDENVDEEMVRALQVAMDCVSTFPERRPVMSEVVTMLEEISGIEPLPESVPGGASEQASPESGLEILLKDLLPSLITEKRLEPNHN